MIGCIACIVFLSWCTWQSQVSQQNWWTQWQAITASWWDNERSEISLWVILPRWSAVSAAFAEDFLHVYSAALQEVNEWWWIAWLPINLHVAYSECEQGSTIMSADRLVKHNEVIALLWWVCMDEILALINYAHNTKIPVFIPSLLALQSTNWWWFIYSFFSESDQLWVLLDLLEETNTERALLVSNVSMQSSLLAERLLDQQQDIWIADYKLQHTQESLAWLLDNILENIDLLDRIVMLIDDDALVSDLITMIWDHPESERIFTKIIGNSLFTTDSVLWLASLEWMHWMIENSHWFIHWIENLVSSWYTIQEMITFDLAYQSVLVLAEILAWQENIDHADLSPQELFPKNDTLTTWLQYWPYDIWVVKITNWALTIQ